MMGRDKRGEKRSRCEYSNGMKLVWFGEDENLYDTKDRPFERESMGVSTKERKKCNSPSGRVWWDTFCRGRMMMDSVFIKGTGLINKRCGG